MFWYNRLVQTWLALADVNTIGLRGSPRVRVGGLVTQRVGVAPHYLAVLAEEGVIPPLVDMLESELEDVLVNSVNAIRVLCDGHSENQTQVARNGKSAVCLCVCVCVLRKIQPKALASFLSRGSAKTRAFSVRRLFTLQGRSSTLWSSYR